MNELVSVVIPVYNAENTIKETVLSILAQSHKDIEIILVDDLSTDKSLDIINEFARSNPKIKVLSSETKGAAGARNTGIKACEGRFLAFLDADDLWRRDKLSKQLVFMEKHDAAFSFTGYEFADENGKGSGTIVKVPETINYKQALKNTTIFTSTVIFDLEKLTKEQVYMPAIKSEDTATWWRILREEKYAYGLDEPLTLYRRSANTLSSNKAEAIRRIWNLYRTSENLSVIYSMYCFCFWALRAVKRRI